MRLGIPGNKSTYVDQEEATLMEKIIKEGEKAGEEIAEGAIMKAGLRLFLNLDMKPALRKYQKLDE